MTNKPLQLPKEYIKPTNIPGIDYKLSVEELKRLQNAFKLFNQSKH
jgi:hypothetical protein